MHYAVITRSMKGESAVYAQNLTEKRARNVAESQRQYVMRFAGVEHPYYIVSMPALDAANSLDELMSICEMTEVCDEGRNADTEYRRS
jgi:hypothetical protein